jgi:alpha-ketoglutarate-dependent taurine dioxygenase
VSRREGRRPRGIGKRPENERLRTPKIGRDKAHSFVAALLGRSKNRTAANLDHYAKRSVLFFSEHTTAKINEVSAAEEEDLFKTLRALISDARFTYRHKWRVGDFIFWAT